MAVELTMPKFGLTMHEGTLQRFFKTPGEAVQAGEPLYEVETEKVLYVVEAPAAGTLAAWFHAEGTIVECGRPVALIAEAGEDPQGDGGGDAGGCGRGACCCASRIEGIAGSGRVPQCRAGVRRRRTPRDSARSRASARPS